nr:transposase [Escherichia coli J53]
MMNIIMNAVTNLILRSGPVAKRWELSLARAVFLHRLGEIRDRKPENQSYRASGLTLLTATISLWNTVYMERAVDALKRKGVKINGEQVIKARKETFEQRQANFYSQQDDLLIL